MGSFLRSVINTIETQTIQLATLSHKATLIIKALSIVRHSNAMKKKVRLVIREICHLVYTSKQTVVLTLADCTWTLKEMFPTIIAQTKVLITNLTSATRYLYKHLEKVSVWSDSQLWNLTLHKTTPRLPASRTKLWCILIRPSWAARHPVSCHNCKLLAFVKTLSRTRFMACSKRPFSRVSQTSSIGTALITGRKKVVGLLLGKRK